MIRRGYTLMEVVIAFVLIGVIGAAIGVASTTLLDDSRDRRSEATIQRVVLAEQEFAQQHGSFTAYTPELSVQDAHLTSGISNAADEVAVALGVDGTLGLAVRRSGETCVLVQVPALDAGGGTKHWRSARASCRGSDALPSDEAEDLDAPDTPKAP